ncbi:VOC family protein [Actinoplanes bogorensis]|uniref:VOC family protein n=1 Tax=Paractinoplanes bogorensis TaxID=1610840 RepID=A0ABS5YFR4_9ACTN|nr:VOC family protein [Actinoplanes bogorensis]MBU2662161.1 VOC family protein [Actinoplanes bogorensis]
MAFHVDLTLDTRDAESLAEFWKLALGYEDEPPPAPFTTRAEWVASFGEDPSTGGGAWLRDPSGVGPRLSLLDVPEPKTAKNRLHLDIRTGQWSGVEAKSAELVAAGGSVLAVFEGHHIVMADPEGNEFCVAP